MRALVTLVIYIAPFVVIGIGATLWMKRKVGLDDARAEGDPNHKGRARFLLGAWYSD
jgi:hypothetical protein